MVIIVDSGSTKADWCIVEEGLVLSNVTTQGISPVHQSSDVIVDIVRKQLFVDTTFCQTLSQCSSEKHINAYFYGSGCIKELVQPLKAILEEAFVEYNVNFHVYNDLLGAARATCGIEPGIACILGTGAYSCLFDGKEIVQNTPPLGYILGDEGSGAVLGKHFLNGIFKSWLDHGLRTEYLAWSGLTYSEIIDKVYRQPMPNRYLASIVPFISQRVLRYPELEQMVVDSFRDFLRLNVVPYRRPDLPVNFVGGVANAFAVQLYKAIDAEGLMFGKIVHRPVRGLMKFHLQ